MLASWLWPETPGNLLTHISPIETWWEVSCSTIPLRSEGFQSQPRSLSQQLNCGSERMGRLHTDEKCAGAAPGPNLPVDLLKPSHYPCSQKMLPVSSSMCSVWKLGSFGSRTTTDLQWARLGESTRSSESPAPSLLGWVAVGSWCCFPSSLCTHPQYPGHCQSHSSQLFFSFQFVSAMCVLCVCRFIVRLR